MPVFSDAVTDVAKHLLNRAASEQGGVLSGDNPAAYNPSNPIRVWVIQLVVILAMTQLLSLGLARMRQPRVIAEVIAGIILGPTVMGRIPKFSHTIFPSESLPFLSLVATIGLVLFLFLVGLEVDMSIVRKNARSSAAISAAGILLPFGLGAAIAVPIYHEFVNPNVSLGYFILFVGVAISITAFPVLCRILTEIRLLDTDVGIVVLSAGVGNDVVGWILLALVVALVNATAPLTALWVLLTCIGFIIFLMFPVNWGYRWLARRSGSLEDGQPTTMMMTVTIVLVFASAFFTDVIGVHAIFGGFLAGLIIPKDNGYAISIVEKLEDLISIAFLPLYFVISGLRTNLGLLDTGTTWGYVFLICTVAFFGKFIGCAVAAKLCGYSNRESGAIGTLMSCKGLVELIVLNIGLQAGILDTRLFSIFVLHAIVLTFLTTPLTIWVYPPSIRQHIGSSTAKPRHDPESSEQHRIDLAGGLKTRFTIVLHKMEYIPVVMGLVQYLQPPSVPAVISEKDTTKGAHLHKVSVDALRLIELTQRTSDVMRGTTQEDLAQRDPLLSVFRTFGTLNRIPVTSALSIVPHDEFASTVSTRAQDAGSDFIIIPWTFAGSSHASEETTPHAHNPFETLFGRSNQPYDKAAAVTYSHFIRQVFAESPKDVGLFLDTSLSTSDGLGIHGLHIFLPFFGGPDDRLALEFVAQLCDHPAVSATVIRITKTDVATVPTRDTEEDVKDSGLPANLTVMSASAFPDTVYPGESPQTRAHSDMADNIAWTKYGSETRSAGRMTLSEMDSAAPLRTVLERGASEGVVAKQASKSLLVVAGRARRLAVESHAVELRAMLAEQHAQYVGGEVRKSLGEVACAVVVSNLKTGLLVVQASSVQQTADV